MEISNIVGASSSQITRRRNKFKLPKNKFLDKHRDFIIKSLNDGIPDALIAKSINVSINALTDYRNFLGLPKNYVMHIDENAVKTLFNSGKSDKEIATELGYSVQHVKKTRFKAKLRRCPKIIAQSYPITDQQF